MCTPRNVVEAIRCEHLGNEAGSQYRLGKKYEGYTRDQKVSWTRLDQEGSVPGPRAQAPCKAGSAGKERREQLAQRQGSIGENKGQREQSRKTQAKNQKE